MSLTELDKCIRRKHTIESPDFIVTDEVFDEYITNQKEGFHSNFVRNDFKLLFSRENYPHIASENQHNASKFHLNRFLLNCIQKLTARGHKICVIYKMNVATFSNERYMTYERYIKQPRQVVELNLSLIIYENPHRIKPLD